jgi:NAD(P)-dependent dehydrogenase (short-subunit alcohol dehydrogenase family)
MNTEQTTPYAIVTGAASGIGFATASRLADDGFAIVAVDMNADGLKDMEQAWSHAVALSVYVADLGDLESIPAMCQSIVADYGAPAVLVNNAGVGLDPDNITDTTLADWQRIMAIDATAPFLLCKSLIPAMTEAGGGAIVNVASVAGMVGVANRLAYCAAKAALVGFTKGLAVDAAGRSITVNAVCPGTTETAWTHKLLDKSDDPDALWKSMNERHLDGRIGTPDEIAAGIAYLASPGARFVNGTTLVIDGGWTAK